MKEAQKGGKVKTTTIPLTKSAASITTTIKPLTTTNPLTTTATNININTIYYNKYNLAIKTSESIINYNNDHQHTVTLTINNSHNHFVIHFIQFYIIFFLP